MTKKASCGTRTIGELETYALKVTIPASTHANAVLTRDTLAPGVRYYGTPSRSNSTLSGTGRCYPRGATGTAAPTSAQSTSSSTAPPLTPTAPTTSPVASVRGMPPPKITNLPSPLA